ncbi:hypothetical protein, partial [Chondromyces apiculatus]|uniref:Uncharacterized protein n=1 Tax=Chondromyces apiculatus DSM 436 TaxID=1192034 RepID=A0A017T9F3_9BACT
MHPGVVLFGLTALAATGCGAGLNAVYEGDVRFERCMALDTMMDVKPTIRQACWEEWSAYYTYGQTRDRVEYAATRRRQLGQTSNFDESEQSLQNDAAAAPAPTPEPTSAPESSLQAE